MPRVIVESTVVIVTDEAVQVDVEVMVPRDDPPSLEVAFEVKVGRKGALHPVRDMDLLQNVSSCTSHVHLICTDSSPCWFLRITWTLVPSSAHLLLAVSMVLATVVAQPVSNSTIGIRVMLRIDYSLMLKPLHDPVGQLVVEHTSPEVTTD